MASKENHMNSLLDLSLLPRCWRYAVFFGFFSLSFGLIYWLIVFDDVKYKAKLLQQEVQLRHQFEQQHLQASSVDAYALQVQNLERCFAWLTQQFFQLTALPGFLDDITQLGQDTGLKFQSFSHLPEIKHDFYIELPIKIVATGSYLQLLRFIQQVSLLKHIVTWDNFIIAASYSKSTHAYLDELQQITMTAKVYRRDENDH